MATIYKFEDLQVWKDARDLAKQLKQLIDLNNDFKRDYKFSSQLRASSGSIMDNIAEGFERNGNMEFRQFLSIAKGSAGETKSQIYRALDYNYFKPEDTKDMIVLLENISKQLNNLIKYLNKKDFKGTKYQ